MFTIITRLYLKDAVWRIKIIFISFQTKDQNWSTKKKRLQVGQNPNETFP